MDNVQNINVHNLKYSLICVGILDFLLTKYIILAFFWWHFMAVKVPNITLMDVP
jgi:hypothetical protein